MFYQLKQRWNRWRFAGFAREIVNTKALKSTADPVTIVSSVSHSDLMMYLVAIKSFFKYCPAGRFLILDDGTLDYRDRNLLRQHLDNCEIRALAEVPFRYGEKGVRWAIILAIADLVDKHYVIQLDSDTVTRARLPELENCISENRSFTLGSQNGQVIEYMAAICDKMKGNSSTHVQVVAEQNFDLLSNYSEARYVRGNSGLAGFAKGSFDRADVELFLKEMTDNLGSKWKERGSFQVTSNVFVSRCPGAIVLPINRYACVTPSIDWQTALFLHFIGRYRFSTLTYARLAAKVVDELNAA